MTTAQDNPGCLTQILNFFGLTDKSAQKPPLTAPNAHMLSQLTSTEEPAYNKSDSLFTFTEVADDLQDGN